MTNLEIKAVRQDPPTPIKYAEQINPSLLDDNKRSVLSINK